MNQMEDIMEIRKFDDNGISIMNPAGNGSQMPQTPNALQNNNQNENNEEEIQDNVPWGDIKVGDLLYVQKNQQVPADIILLDSNEIFEKQAVTWVDTSYVDGQQDYTKKIACSITQSI